MVILVLGKGCKNCATLEKNVSDAAAENNIAITLKKVTDINEIADYGVMRTPALVINDKVVSQGKVLDKAAAEKLLKSV